MKISDNERALLRFFSSIKKQLDSSRIKGWHEQFEPEDEHPYIIIFGEYAEKLEQCKVYIDEGLIDEIKANPIRPIVERFVGPIKTRLGFTYGIDITDPSGELIHSVPHLLAGVMYELNGNITVIRNTREIGFRLHHLVYGFKMPVKTEPGEYQIMLKNGQNLLEVRTYVVGKS